MFYNDIKQNYEIITVIFSHVIQTSGVRKLLLALGKLVQSAKDFCWNVADMKSKKLDRTFRWNIRSNTRRESENRQVPERIGGIEEELEKSKG